jgi:hypothetical protein
VALDVVRTGWSCLTVPHRLFTIRDVNQIAIVDREYVKETKIVNRIEWMIFIVLKGIHDELLQNSESFWKIDFDPSHYGCQQQIDILSSIS